VLAGTAGLAVRTSSSDLDRDRLLLAIVVPVLPADGARVRDERRRVRRRARRTRHRPESVAAAALLTDYVLTVAAPISAGIYAITSFAPR
jgi:hypothetical protein